MLHLLYIIAFTVIAFFAVTNLIRSLINVGMESQKMGHNWNRGSNANAGVTSGKTLSHPELLDEQGKPINEPLLVMRSVNVDDARQKLDVLYNDSPGNSSQDEQKE